MNQKGFAPILIVILIALAVGGYLLYQKQVKPVVIPQTVIQPTSVPVISPVASDSAETANWKTYTNTDGKYLIKYPSDYLLEETDSIKTPEKFPVGKKQVAIKSSAQVVNFIIYINYYPILDLSQTNEAMQQVSGCDSENVREIKNGPKGRDFIIGDQTAILYEDSLCAQFTAANFYSSHNDRVYSISVASTEKYGLHKTIVDQILSTFKFTN